MAKHVFIQINVSVVNSFLDVVGIGIEWNVCGRMRKSFVGSKNVLGRNK